MNILLNAVTEGSVLTAQALLDVVHNQLNIEEVSLAGYFIAVNFGYFIKHHATTGARPKVVHNSVDAVVGAAYFSDVELSYNQLVNTLVFEEDTKNFHKLLKHIHDQRVKYMKEKKSPFRPLDERRQKKYCVRHKGQKCVYNFFH